MTLTELCSITSLSWRVASVMKTGACGWRRMSTGSEPRWSWWAWERMMASTEPSGDELQVGQRRFAVEARVQPGIEDDAFAGEFEAVAVGADFDPPREIGKSETTHVLRRKMRARGWRWQMFSRRCAEANPSLPGDEPPLENHRLLRPAGGIRRDDAEEDADATAPSGTTPGSQTSQRLKTASATST